MCIRDRQYGTAIEDCVDNKVAVLTPHGLRRMKNVPELNIISFYINVDRRERLIQLLRRGDNIEEVYRRNLSDIGQFDGVEEDVDVYKRQVLHISK